MEYDKHPDPGNGLVGHAICSGEPERPKQSVTARRRLRVCSVALLILSVLGVVFFAISIVRSSSLGPHVNVFAFGYLMNAVLWFWLSRETGQGKYVKLTIGLLLFWAVSSAVVGFVALGTPGEVYPAVGAWVGTGMAVTVACIAIRAHMAQNRS